MDITETTYVLCLVSIPFTGGDLLFTICREQDEPTQWQLEYRFRYHKDDQVWDSTDTKNFYHGNPKGTEAEMEEALKKTVAGFTAKFISGPPEWCYIRGGYEKFMEVMQKNPPSFMHMKFVKELDEEGTIAE